MTQDVNANDVVAFFVEIGALVLLGWWAWQVPESTGARIACVVVVLAAAIAAWGMFAAPQASIDVPGLALATKVLVLGGSVLAAFALSTSPGWPIGWAVTVLVNTLLMYLGPFAR